MAVTVTVNAAASHEIPSTLCTAASLTGWQALNGATIRVIRESTPVSSRLPNALQVVFPRGRPGAAGFANTGYAGIKITSGTTYKASFYYRFPNRSNFNGNLTVRLQTANGQVLATANVPVSGSQTTWNQVTFDLVATATPSSTSNLFSITADGAQAAGQTIHFTMLSLFPPTFKNRANGMRVDLAEALVELAPSFFRFPGGNNLEGQTVERRWQWNATARWSIDREARSNGRLDLCQHRLPSGLGLLEYLYWCEDINAEPIMGVWAGYALGGTSVPENQLGPYIQQAIDQINFAIGDPDKSAPAALRRSLGRTEPFAMRFVEIGNEDWFASESYIYRWKHFANALQAEFPQLSFIATTRPYDPVLTPRPTHYDVHVYQTPTWFAQNSFYYDSFQPPYRPFPFTQRNGTKYFEGEYAAISTNPNDLFGSPANGRLVYPTMQSAAGEAAFMTGLERNSDIVFAAAYAPLIGHATRNQWFFSVYRGDEYLPSTLPSRTGTQFWSVVRKKSTREIIIKTVNVAPSAGQFTFVLPFNNVASTGTAYILSGGGTSSNTPSNPNAIVPRTVTIPTGKRFDFTAPGVSVCILIFEAY
ncbi:alpha-L-arabinofuranosidase A [Coprinopsis cinerea okayama7|uniref:non-reducing end alpha-L-arabinofuranosidase n=1 Tax=Coprinopsis cinerea (strain Okayama-7 / 130 / ATCC MYA-4618 / FGSC 9003) TaxID=240176 RepID=A8PCI8_COPC7|nr:alpha-L-arabinofuranosidase A [Coprinopsis cinerea okayama7\|eukprot:XP_001840409.2 alpha-L-arabinofuranosidase A [Coprinopsis cinerea okayama7\